MGWFSFKSPWPANTPPSSRLGGLSDGLGSGFGVSTKPGPKKALNWDPVKQAKLVQVFNIRSGDGGTEDTINVMTKLALDAAKDPQLVFLARSIVQDVPSKDYRTMVERIFAWVKANIRYLRDPLGLEYVSAPLYTIYVSGAEDCDGQSVVLAALTLAIGLGAGYRVLWADSSRPLEASHVYAVLGIPDKASPGGVLWLPADATQGSGTPLGWEPPPEKIRRSKTWIISPP